MNAPGRYYIFKWDDGYRTAYEVKPGTYVEFSDRFRVHERPVYLDEYRSLKWAFGESLYTDVAGWYDTLDEVRFAIEVLL